MAEVKLTPLKAIRAKCLDCCCQQASESGRAQLPSVRFIPTEWAETPTEQV